MARLSFDSSSSALTPSRNGRRRRGGRSALFVLGFIGILVVNFVIAFMLAFHFIGLEAARVELSGTWVLDGEEAYHYTFERGGTGVRQSEATGTNETFEWAIPGNGRLRIDGKDWNYAITGNRQVLTLESREAMGMTRRFLSVRGELGFTDFEGGLFDEIVQLQVDIIEMEPQITAALTSRFGILQERAGELAYNYGVLPYNDARSEFGILRAEFEQIDAQIDHNRTAGQRTAATAGVTNQPVRPEQDEPAPPPTTGTTTAGTGTATGTTSTGTSGAGVTGTGTTPGTGTDTPPTTSDPEPPADTTTSEPPADTTAPEPPADTAPPSGSDSIQVIEID